jgi:diguanylate cyclase (GGDEF)-like protein
MKKNIAQLRLSSTVFGLALIAMLWFGICLKYFQDSRAELNDAIRGNDSLSLIFGENVLRTIGEIDKVILYLRRAIEARNETTDFQMIVDTSDVRSEIIVQVAIIDAKGILRASNAGPQPAPALDLSDREHYRAHLNSEQDRLFIGKPLSGRASGQWSVQFTRRFLNRDGSFGGVIVVSLNPDHLTKFYNEINLSTTAIALVGEDGVVRASGGSLTNFRLGDDLNSTDALERARGGNGSTFEVGDAESGDTRLVTFRRIRGQPLWVMVSKSLNQVYSSSLSDLKLHSVVGLLITFLVLLAMARILQNQAKVQQKAEELHLALERVNQGNLRLDAAIENMSHGLAMFDRERKLIVCNKRYAEVYGLPQDMIRPGTTQRQILEHRIAMGAHDGTDPEQYIKDRIEVATAGKPEDALLHLSNGRIVAANHRPMADGGWVSTHEDVTERRRAEERIAYLARHDALTGLSNRTLFREQIEEELRRAMRGDSVALLCLDLDHFKATNDTLGHHVGDLLLKAVAERLRVSVRDIDAVARLGGDEFAIAQVGLRRPEEAEALARRLVEALGEPFDLEGHQVVIGASIGIAIAPNDRTDAERLLRNADMALYCAKSDGRNTFRFFEPEMDARLQERRTLELELRKALTKGEFELHYQPLVNIETERVVGFEALIRWNHPKGEIVSPDAFIPLAEETGLIVPLGEWVLRQACSEAVRWGDLLHVAINVSPVQFRNQNLVPAVLNALASSGLRPDRLELEITESVLLQDTEANFAILHQLKALGIKISMDDFGTGYSSLGYLRSFPFDKIKIDRSFVKDLSDRTESVAVIRAISSLGTNLGIATTAEGVETMEQLERLRAEGCLEMQGYLFSPPRPASEILQLLEQCEALLKRAA